MKPTARIVFLAAVLALFLAAAFANPRPARAKGSKARRIESLTALKSGTIHDLSMDGVFRYSLHIPESYDPVLGATLLIFCENNSRKWTPETAMDSVLECEEVKSMIVLVPLGSGYESSFHYCAGDSRSILELLKELEGPKHGLILPVKIATGRGNGASFTYTMLNHYDVINGILAWGGRLGIYGGMPSSGAKARKQPVVLMSAKEEAEVRNDKRIDTDLERFEVAKYENLKYIQARGPDLDTRAFDEGLAWIMAKCEPARAVRYLAMAKAYSKEEDYSTAMEYLNAAEACATVGADKKTVEKAAAAERKKIDKQLKKILARIRRMKAGGAGRAEALAAFARKYPGTSLIVGDEKLSAELKSAHESEGARLFEEAKAAMESNGVGRAYALYYRILYDYPLASCAAEARKEIDRIERDRLYWKKAEEYSKAKYDTAFSEAMVELREDDEDAAITVLRQFLVDSPGGPYSRRARYILALID